MVWNFIIFILRFGGGLALVAVAFDLDLLTN